MKVYVLKQMVADGEVIVGIFSDDRLANERAERLKAAGRRRRDYEMYEVEEHTLDGEV